MDYEPAFVAHPSYQLEDSSEGSDWDEDELPASRRNKVEELPRESDVQLEGSVDKLTKGGKAVFLVGEAGERMAQGVELIDDLIKVLVDGQQCGAIAPPQTEGRATLVFLSTSIQLSHLHPIASYLIETLSPSSCDIIASYHLPSYIPSSDSDSPSSFSSRLPILCLSSPSAPTNPALASLRSSKLVEPYEPPNLLHGLPSSLLIVASLFSPAPPATLVLIPTTTPPRPLNGPFSHLSPVTQPSVTTLYDAGGPVGLSDPAAQFRLLARDKIAKIKDALEWDWWNVPEETSGRKTVGIAGKGFEWLEKERKLRKKEETSSMFM
ncbi:hypothetical protein JCM16303_006679 [Sporobolomyces ruberrimus]